MGYQSRDRKNIIRRFDRMERSLYLPAEKDLVDAFEQYLGGAPPKMVVTRPMDVVL